MSDKLNKVTGNESLRKYFDSPYMGAYSISDGTEPIVTISKVLFGKITLDGGRKEEHVVLEFAEKSVCGMSEVKPLVLNATNQKTLEKLCGKGADVLIGKKIQFYINPAVRAIGGGTTEGVRIRPFVPKETAPIKVEKCAECGNEVKGFGNLNAAQVGQYTLKKYGRVLCSECAEKQNNTKGGEMIADE